MALEVVLVIGLAAAAIALMGVILALALRTAPPALGFGVLVRIACPVLRELLRVRVGKDRHSGELTVLWCERFGDAAITCDRACLTAPGEAVAAAP